MGIFKSTGRVLSIVNNLTVAANAAMPSLIASATKTSVLTNQQCRKECEKAGCLAEYEAAYNAAMLECEQ